MWNENNPDNNSNSNYNIGSYHDTYSPSFSEADNEINNLNNSNIRHNIKYRDNGNDNNDDMNISIVGLNNEYYEEKRQKRSKLIKILSIILIILIIILIAFFIYKVVSKKEDKKVIKPSADNSIKNIYIEDESMSPNFDGEIRDYYVLTNKKELEIKCDLGKDSDNVLGCNQKINLGNMSYYIHQIYSDNGSLYRINIKTKDSDDENLISINSISGIDKATNQSVIMKVNASSKTGGLMYSIDNGETYQSSNTFTIDDNQKIYLIVKDRQGNVTPVRKININNIDKELPTANIEITKSSEKSVTITVFGRDNSDNLLYSFDDGEFSKNNSIELKESRQVKVLVKDEAGNISNDLGIFVRKSDFVNKTKYLAKFYKNGSKISNNYAICTYINDKCVITLPEIEREGFTILGWSKDKNSHNPEYKSGQRISLSSDIELYAITKKDVSITFDYNGILPNKHVKSCIIYGEEYCNFEVPNFTFDKGKIIGWNLKSDSESVLLSSGNKYQTQEDMHLYALAYRSLKISFDKNGADSISSNEINCKIINNTEGCNVILPDITKSGAESLGWSTNPNNNKAEYAINKKSLITDNLKLYAITQTVVNIDFDRNGSDSVSSNRVSCIYYNKARSCNIKTPIIKRNGANIMGWNTNKDARNATVAQNDILTVKESNKFYAITSVPVNIRFERNGANSIEFTNQSCTYYNASKGCNINTPSIVRSGWNIIGWNTSKNGTYAMLGENSTGIVYKSATYYAVTSKSATATFNKYVADSLFGCSNKTSNGCVEKCTYYNNSNSCKVKVPFILSKGNEVQLFSTSTNVDSLSGYTPGTTISINSDITLYAIAKNYYRGYTLSISNIKTYGQVPFETEKSCPSSIYSNYYSFVNRLYKNAPYIFTAGKVTFTGKNVFESIWGEESAGMTYGRVVGYRNVDIICPPTYDRYYLKTIVHELTHTWDSYYKLRYGEYLSSMPEIVRLYNKYSKLKTRPLRNYSYSNRMEFTADMFAWYYFIYIDTAYRPKAVNDNLYYPNDMKTAMEKYIKIAKNGYK